MSVTGTSVAEVNVAGMVVATPSTVVTTPVVNVRMDLEREVMGVVMDEVSTEDIGDEEDSTADVAESAALEVGGLLLEVVGMTVGVEDVVISVPFPVCRACLLCTSRRA